MKQLDFYPFRPGFKELDTSKEAAENIAPRAHALRLLVLDVLRRGCFSADQLAELLSESVLSIRPRVSELLKLGLVQDTGRRTKNKSGHSAKIWRAT